MHSDRVLRGLIILGIALVAAVLGMYISGANGQVYSLLLLVLLLFILAFTFRPERKLSLVCDPMILVFIFFAQFYLVGPISMIVFDFHIHTKLSPSQTSLILLAFLTLMVSFFLGHQTKLGTMLERLIPVFRNHPKRLPGRAFEVLLISISLLFCLVYINARGGLGFILGTQYGRSPYNSFYLLAFHGLLAGTLLFLWRILDSRKANRFDLFVFLGLLVFEFLFFGILLGGRKRIIYIALALLTIFILRKGTAHLPRAKLVVAMALLLAFFSYWGAVRSRSVSAIVAGRVDPRWATTQYHMGYFRSVAEPFTVAGMVLEIYPRLEPFKHGRTVLVTVLGFIPRAVWPDKPVGIGKELTIYTDGVHYDPKSVHSVTPTLVGDFYINFGWTGLVFGGLILGISCRAISRHATSGMVKGLQTNASKVLLTAIFISGLVEVRADSAVLLSHYALMLIPLVPGFLLFNFNYSQETDRGRAS